MNELELCGVWKNTYERFSGLLLKTGLPFLLVFTFFTSSAQVSADFSVSITEGCSPLVVCFTDMSTGNPDTWLWNFGNGNLSPDQNPCAIYINPGTYTVSLTVSKGGSSDTKTVTALITVFQDPNADLSANKTLGCEPFTVDFTDLSTPGDAPVTSWEWDFGDGNTSTQQNPSNTYTNPGTYTVILLVRDANGCTHEYSADSLITVLPSPEADFTAAPTFSCSYPATISFTDLSTASPGSTYLWDFGDGGTSTQTDPSHTYTSPGSYTVKLTITDAAGCSNTKTRTDFLVIADLQADFSVNKTSGCGNVNVSFTDQSSTVSTITDWHWDFGDGGTSTVQNTWHNYSTPGTYTVSLEVTNSNGCSNTIVYPDLITVNPEPNADFTADNTQGCVIPFNVNFSDNSTDAVSWLWDFGDGNTSTQQNPSHAYTSLGSYGVRLTVTSADGCTDSYFIPNYIDIAAPQANFTADITEGCIDLMVNFQDQSNSVEPITNWFWDFGDGNTSTQQDPTNIYSTDGEYDVTLVITNSAGCKDTLKRPAYIAAGDTPVVNFGANPTAACLFDVVSFFDSTNVGDEWYWDFGDGGTSTSQNPSHQYSDTGSFTITLIVSNNGCDDTLIRDSYISISPPKSQFTVTYNCVNPYEVEFTDNSIAPDLWSWNFGDGDTSNTKDNIHTYDTTGTFPVSLFVQDTVSGCFDSSTVNVTVTDPVADFSASPLSGCAPLIVYFNSTAIDASGFSWDFGDGGTSTQQDPIYTYNTGGVYDVKLIVTDIHGCTDTIIKTNYITVHDVTAYFAADTLFGCTPLTVHYIDSSSSFLGAIDSWHWEFGDGDTSNIPNPSKTYFTPGIYSVTLSVTDTNGCSDSLTRVDYVVPTFPFPEFEASDTVVCLNQDITFTNLSIGSGMSYVWDFGDGDTSSAETPVHAYDAPGLYTVSLHVTDVNGCDSTETKPLYIEVLQPHAGLDADSTFASCPPLWVNFTDLTPPSDSITDWLWFFGDGQTSDLQNPTHVYIRPDTFWAHMVVENYIGCRDTTYLPDPIIVTGPRGTFDFIQDEYCIDVPVQFFSDAADTIIHIYDYGDGNIGVFMGGDTITHWYRYPGTFNPSLVLDDGHGCVISIDHPDSITTFTVEADFTSDISYLCHANMVQFYEASTGTPGADSWYWDFGDGNTSSLQNPTHYYSVPGKYDVMMVVTNATGCTDTMIKPEYITVDEGPSAQFTSDSVACVPLVAQFTDKSVSDSTIISWSWDFGDGDTSHLQNPSHVFTTVDTFTVTLMIETVVGCRDTTSKTVIAHPIPVADAGPDQTICQGDTVQLNGTGGISYWWSPATGLSDSNIANPLAFPMDSTDYVLTVVDANGCTDIDTTSVHVNPLPAVNITPDTSICIGESVQLSASGGVTYTWMPDSSLNNGNIANPIATPTTTTTYNVTVVDINGCTNTASMTITVNPLPNPTASATQKVFCEGNTTQLHATGGVSYVWSPTIGLSDPYIPDPTAGPSNSHTYTVTVTDSNGCVNTASVNLVINPAPFPSTTADTVICIYDSVQLTASGGFEYFWYPSSNLSCDTCSNPIAFPTSTTMFYVDVTNNLGCTSTDSVLVTVNPLPNITITNDTPICNGTSFQLNASGGVTYNWTPSTTLSCSTCPNPVATTSTTTIYTVEATSPFGCVNKDSMKLTVHQYKSKVDMTDSVACVPATIHFTDLSVASGSIVNWAWDFGDGAADSVQHPSHRYTAAGNYDVKLRILTSNGCIDSTVKPIIINGLPTADPGPDHTICFGDSVQFGASGGLNYEWFPATWLSDPNIADPMVVPDSTTNYTVIVTDINGCKDTASNEVIVNPLPVAAITNNNPNICQHDSIQLNATGGVSYSWSPVTGLSDPNISNPTAKPNALINYSVLVTDSNGCQDMDDITVQVYTSPNPFISPDTSICLGDTVQISLTGGGVSYDWSPSEGLNCDTCKNPIAVPDTTTTYYVDVTNASGCTTTKSMTITVEPLPAISITQDSFICSGKTIQLTATGGVSFTWSPAQGLSNPSIPNPLAAPDSSATYAVEVASAFGCIDHDTVDLEVVQMKTSMQRSDTAACMPASIQFTDLTTSTDSIVSWLWDFDDNTGSNNQHPSNVFTAPGTYDVQLIVTSIRGCVDSISQPVIIHGLPTADAGPDTTLCFGESTQLDASGGGNYDWFPATGLSNSNIASPLAQPNETTWYELMVTDSNGCEDLDSMKITINPLPVTTISTGASLCYGDSAQLNATGGATYAWSPTQGLSNPDIANPKASPESTTIYLVEITNEFDCSVLDSVLVEIRPLPDIQIKARGEICLGDSTEIKVSGASTYEWDPPTSLSCSNCDQPIASPDSSITYLVTMTDDYDCVWYDTVPIKVWPLPQVQTTADQTICKNEEIELTSEAQLATSFNWEPAHSLNYSDILSPIAKPMQTTEYIITASTDHGCMDQDSVVITVIDHVQTTLQDNMSVCLGESITLEPQIDQASQSGTNVIWMPPQEFYDPTQLNQNIIPLESRLYTMIAYSGTCSPDTQFVYVNVNDLPTVDAGDDQTVMTGTEVNFNATSPDNIIAYTWSPEYDLSCVNCQSTSAVVDESQTFYVDVVDANGCPATDSVYVRVVSNCNGEIFVPNAFTPNNDEINDVFRVRSTGLLQLMYFKVFDRWGNLVFATEDKDEGWDGIYNGKMVNMDVFVYHVKAACPNGQVIMKKGNVTAIR